MASPAPILQRKARWKEFRGILLQILKWSVVVWCFLPLARFSKGAVPFSRILLGILLFILFSGKFFYDTVLFDMIRRRRTTLKQDIFQLLGMLLAVGLIVTLVILMIAAYIMESSKPPENTPWIQ